jgi:hypothetical protein
MTRRTSVAFAVLLVGAMVAATGGADGGPAELPAFLLLAGAALFFASRKGTFVILTVISILSVWNNYDQSSAGPTAREIGAALLFFLLVGVVVVGAAIDLVLGLVWRSTRSLPPGA